MTDDRAAIDGFTGVARLFPLPNLVLFPHVDQGLHIFEPRYRQMMADALASDLLIAMVLLKPGWEPDYDHRPPIEPVACLGRITRWEKLPDGRYNLRLRGIARLKIDAEVPDCSKLYRFARGPLLADVMPPDLSALTALRRELREVVLARFTTTGTAHPQLTALFDGDTPLGEVCDLLAYSLPLSLDVKQQLLNEAEVTARAGLLRATLDLPRSDRGFPPVFSPN